MHLVHFALSAVAGVFVVRTLLPMPALRPGWARQVFGLAAGAGVGAGLASVIYFLALFLAGPGLGMLLGADVILAAAAAGCWHFVRKRQTPEPAEPVAAHTVSRWTAVFGVAAAVSLLMFLLAFSEAIEQNPQGDWDAWSIWNVKAKFLTRGDTWKFAFSPLFRNQPDYPLLTPALIAGGWVAQGSASSDAPAAAALLFTLASLGLLTSAVALARSASMGFLAAVLLLGHLGFGRWAPSQYADVPTGFYLLAALSALAAGGGRGGLALAGLSASLAAWTKNEGLPILLGVAIAAAVLIRLQHRPWREYAAFLAGAAPVLAVLAAFKLALAPPPTQPLFSAGIPQIAAMLIDPARYSTILGIFFREVAQAGTLPWHPLLTLPLVMIGLGFRTDWRTSGLAALAIPVLCLAAADFGVLIISQYDLLWHAGGSMGRLLVQMWPAFLLSLVVLLKRPEDFAPSPGPAPEKGRKQPPHTVKAPRKGKLRSSPGS